MTGSQVFDGLVQIKLSASDMVAAHSGTNFITPTNAYSGIIYSEYIFNSALKLLGYSLTFANSEDDDGATWESTLVVDDLGIDDTRSGSGWLEDFVVIVEFDLTIWATDQPIFLTKVHEIRWDINGSVTTPTIPTSEITTTGLAPNYLQIGGEFPIVDFDWAAGAVVTDYPNPYDFTSEITGTMGCGYRFKRSTDSLWTTPTIALRSPVVPDCFDECQVCVSATGMISGSNTWDITTPVRSWARSQGIWTQAAGASGISLSKRADSQRSGCSSLQIMPNLARQAIKRPIDDYAQLWERGGFPEAVEIGRRTCGPAEPPDDGNIYPDPYSKTVEIQNALYPERSKFLGVVRGGVTHTIEQPASLQTCWMPYSVARDFNQGVWINELGIGSAAPGTYPVTPEYKTNFIADRVLYRSVENVQRRAVDNDSGQNPNGDLLPYTNFEGTAAPDDPSKYLRLLNWAACWWAYGAKAFNWSVDSSDTDRWLDYWAKIGQQMMYHPALPGADVSNTRVDLISSPLVYENGNGVSEGFMEVKAFGARQPWAGQWNFRIRPFDLPSTVTLDSDSADRWLILDADDDPVAATFGATYIDIPLSATTIKFSLASWTVKPWLACAIAQKFRFDWDLATCDSVQVYLDGADGASLLLCDDLRATTIDWNDLGALPGTKFAGTWGAVDYGVAAITDSPADVGASGDSAAMMSDSIRVIVSQLLRSRTAQYLRFVIVPASGATSVKLKYPIFTLPTATPVLKYLGRQFSQVLWENGPTITLGGLQWWDYDLDVLRSTPIVQGPGSPSSIVDAYCVQRALEGLDPTGSINTAIGAVFDDIEADPLVGSKAMNAAYESMAWPDVLNAKLAYLWHVTYSPPPIPMLCGPARDTELDASDGSAFAGVWDWGVEPRRLIVAGSTRSDLVRFSPDETWTALDVEQVDGYTITVHRHTLDNNEDGFKIIRAAIPYAEDVRPWHSWFWVPGADASVAGDGPYNLVSPIGQYHRTWSSDGGIKYARSAYLTPPFEQIIDVTSASSDDSKPRALVNIFGVIDLIWDRAGSGVMRAFSSDDGATWTTPSVFMADRYFGTNKSDKRGRVVFGAFKYDSGTSGPGEIVYRLQMPSASSPAAEVSVKNAGGTAYKFEPEQFSFTWLHDEQDRIILTAKADGATEPSEWISSDDLATWEPI